MKQLILVLMFFCIFPDTFGQSQITGRQYIGEGIPVRWFKMMTDSTGIYYSKGDVGHTELWNSPLTWGHINDSTIRLLVYNTNYLDTFDLIMNHSRDYFYEKDMLEIFHRKPFIEFDGKIYSE